MTEAEKLRDEFDAYFKNSPGTYFDALAFFALSPRALVWCRANKKLVEALAKGDVPNDMILAAVKNHDAIIKTDNIKMRPETAAERDRLRESNAELLAVLELISSPIGGKPVGDPFAFYRDLQSIALAAIARARARARA